MKLFDENALPVDLRAQQLVRGILPRALSPLLPVQLEPHQQFDFSDLLAAILHREYGNATTLPFTLVGGVAQLVLRRPPQGRRIELLIQNLNVAGNVAYSFDFAPSIAGSVNIVPGGNRLFDTVVPQGDVYLLCSGAASGVIEYVNKEISKVT